jgi:hypothetical protein
MGGGPSFDEYDEEEVLRALREKRLADSMASEPSARFDGAANLATREYLDAKAPQGPDYAKYMDWQPTPDHPHKEAELRALLPGFQASDPENAADYRSRLDAILATKPGASSPVSEFASGGARPPGVMGNLVDFVSQGARIAAPIGKHFAPVPAKVAPPPAATPGAEPELAPLVQPQKQAAPAPAPKAVRVSKAPKSPGITTQEAIAALNEGLADAPWKEKAPPPVATPPPAVVERASGGDPRLASALSRMMAGGGGLDMALQSSNQNRLIASLARAGGMAIGRGKSEAYDNLDANADRPLQELQMRRQESATAAEADPNSPQSQTLRMALARMVPDLAKQPGWESKSAAQLKQLFPFAKEIAEAEARKSDKQAGIASAKEKADADRAERAREADQRSRDSRYNADAVRSLGGEKFMDKQVETLSKRTEGSAAMKADLDTLDKYAAGGDIPGKGATGWLPDIMVSNDGIKVRQAARGVIGSLIKMRSGTAASEREVDRILGELGMGDTASDDQMRAGIARLREQATEELRSKEAGARPEAVREARGRGLVTSQDMGGGAVRMRGPSGEVGTIDPSELKDAEANGWTRI